MQDWQQHFIRVGAGGSDDYRQAMATCTEQITALFEAAQAPYSGIDPLALRAAIARQPLSQESVVPLAAAIEEAGTLIGRNSILVQHPHCIAHLHTPPMIAGMVADRFMSAQNQSLDSWDQSGAATYVEQHVIDWMCELFGYAGSGDGVFTSGGTQGNIMALLIARDWAAHRISGHDVQRDGLPPYFSKLRIVGSAKSHFTLRKAAALMGLGQQAMVTVPSHPDGTMVVEALEPTLAGLRQAGLIPFAVVGTAGTTDHGAVDDLRSIAAIAQQHQAWFHVDAAYGGALMLSRARHRLAGIEQADSVIVDFHKLWFQPISCGAILLKDRGHFRHLLHRAEYLNRESDELPNLVDKSISATRRFDALKVWMTLRAVGAATIGAMVDHLLEQTQAVAGLVRDRPALRLLARPSLSTILFRYVGVPQADALDDFNRRLRVGLLKAGVAVLGETMVDGQVALKLTILNPCLSMGDFEQLLDKITDFAARLPPAQQPA
ncbi:pyridoxal phosphate-dependent decarboxylase family protein [Eleftheria terrae]|uniref:pyridoxal phosphate-dependent decarboxylase family protein n=1 Tax=Eleftheria terrae TaxID=1597781 RepID=UPI00263B7F8A|nr:aspartate aminotransferase family protein [Eleftheria terrae]WKB50630.1 aspartate aminotransferase family protein [Eleftheria terrae]